MYVSGRTKRVMRGAITMVAAVIALFAVAAPGASAATYTALGDSYAAGPLIPNQSLNPLGCLRSDHDYAHLTAAAKGLTLTDVSCSGATTNDMTEAQNVEPGPNPPQFNGLNASTNVVSVTIGGNDIGFTEIIESCITYNPFSTPCKDKYDPGGHDQLAERIANAAPKVAAVLQGIHARSPNARVFVVNYPDILPSGSGVGRRSRSPSATCPTCTPPRNGSMRCWRRRRRPTARPWSTGTPRASGTTPARAARPAGSNR